MQMNDLHMIETTTVPFQSDMPTLEPAPVAKEKEVRVDVLFVRFLFVWVW